jgi:YHS domain-containing protein
VVRIQEGTVGFCSREHRDRFQHAVSYFRECVKGLAAHDAHHPTMPGAYSINRQCPWTGKPVEASATTRFEGHTVGFATTRLRDEFRQAVDAAAGRRADAAATGHTPGEHPPSGRDHGEGPCPICDRATSPNVTATIEGGTVSFCTPEHRDQFLRAIAYLRECCERARGSDCAEVVKIVLHC